MTQRWAIPLLVLAFIAFYLLPLGTHGLWIPDETRYAQIGQQILIDGNAIGGSDDLHALDHGGKLDPMLGL